MYSKIVSVRKVANGSFQAEMAGTIDRPGSVNVLAELNKGDERFNRTNLRRAWFPVTLLSLQELGVDALTLQKIKNLEEYDKVELNIENPQLHGEALCIQINETIVPDVWQRQNVTKSAKQLMITDSVAKSRIATDYPLEDYIGQNGYFMDKDGNFIFSRGIVTVASQVRHNFVEGQLVPETELATFGGTLAESTPVSVEETEDIKF